MADKKDALLSRDRVVRHIMRAADAYRLDGSRLLASILSGLARRIDAMEPEYQAPLSMDEMSDPLAAEGAEGRVWLEHRHEERFERVSVSEAMKPRKAYVKDRKTPVAAYNVSIRAWLTLPSEDEIKAARWGR